MQPPLSRSPPRKEYLSRRLIRGWSATRRHRSCDTTSRKWRDGDVRGSTDSFSFLSVMCSSPHLLAPSA